MDQKAFALRSPKARNGARALACVYFEDESPGGRANGDLFGTTSGFPSTTYPNGTVFEIAKTASGYASTPTTLVSFNGTDGSFPEGSLFANARGNLFGTTLFGGAHLVGTVFEITGSGFAFV